MHEHTSGMKSSRNGFPLLDIFISFTLERGAWDKKLLGENKITSLQEHLENAA